MKLKCIFCKKILIGRQRRFCSQRCHFQEWYLRNKDKAKENAKRNRKYGSIVLRVEALKIYGNQCACCGEKQTEFLSLDHIIPVSQVMKRKDRAYSRIGFYSSGDRLVRWLKKNSYPSGIQVLCYNCNLAKGHRGECPHKAMKNGNK